MDYLFKPGYGASLDIIKVEIGGDTWSTDGSEPSHKHTRDDLNFERGWEAWLLQEAKKRNPAITTYALAWGAPGWVGKHNYYSDDNIYNYTLVWLDGIKTQYDIDMDYIGIWNEKACPDATYITRLRKALDQSPRHHNTKIVALDMGLGRDTLDLQKKMASDPVLNASIDVIGVHYPRGTADPGALQLGKKLWASESLTTSADWAGATLWATTLNQNFVKMNATSAIAWSLIWSVYPSLICDHHGLMDAMEPWSGYFRVAKQIWVTAHTTLFARQGWVYANQGAGSGWVGSDAHPTCSYVTLVSPNRTQFATIIEWMSPARSKAAPVAQDFQLLSPLPQSGSLWVWVTNASVSMQPLGSGAITIGADGKWSLTVRPLHMYTVTNVNIDPALLGGGGTLQRNAVDTAPKTTPLSLPHTWTFDDTPVHHPGRYMNDQGGSFEVSNQPESGSNNHVLQQMVLQDPIAWGHTIRPATIFGPYYQNYVLSASARFGDTTTPITEPKNVVMGDCAGAHAGWVLMPDHTVRPALNHSRCLTSTGHDNLAPLTTDVCGATATGTQQWSYTAANASTGHPLTNRLVLGAGTHETKQSMCAETHTGSNGVDLYACCSCPECCCGCEEFVVDRAHGTISNPTKDLCVAESTQYVPSADSVVHVGICGRLGQPDAGGFGFESASSTCLTLFRNSTWQLRSGGSAYSSSGTFRSPAGIGGWHRMSLEFSDCSVVASVNGDEVQRANLCTDFTSFQDHGNAVLLSSQHASQFDNVTIAPHLAHPVQMLSNSHRLLAHSTYHGNKRRFDFSGLWGAVVEVNAAVTVTALGRFVCALNSTHAHDLSLMVASASPPSVVASVSLHPSTITDAAGFAFVHLPTPVSLRPGRYYLVSSEVANTDCGYGFYTDSCGGHSGGLPLMFSDITAPMQFLGGVYRTQGAGFVEEIDSGGELQRSYGPLNAIYHEN